MYVTPPCREVKMSVEQIGKLANTIKTYRGQEYKMSMGVVGRQAKWHSGKCSVHKRDIEVKNVCRSCRQVGKITRKAYILQVCRQVGKSSGKTCILYIQGYLTGSAGKLVKHKEVLYAAGILVLCVWFSLVPLNMHPTIQKSTHLSMFNDLSDMKF